MDFSHRQYIRKIIMLLLLLKYLNMTMTEFTKKKLYEYSVLQIDLPSFFWVFVTKCKDVRCSATPITYYNWNWGCITQIFQDNGDDIGSTFYNEGHYWYSLTNPCYEINKSKTKKKKQANQIKIHQEKLKLPPILFCLNNINKLCVIRIFVLKCIASKSRYKIINWQDFAF